jgi:hypothetical protein
VIAHELAGFGDVAESVGQGPGSCVVVLGVMLSGRRSEK